jgi:DNA-binding beta-propeller fold protein YncE
MSVRRTGFASVAALAALALPPQQAADLLYVCVQDDATIAVVDMSARKVVRTIDLTARGFSVTAKPHYIAVEPDGVHWYVSLIGANRVLKFDSRDSIVGQFEMETPGMLSLEPGGNRLGVSRSMSAVNPPSRIALIDRTTMKGEEHNVLFPRPHPMVVSRNGYAYTGSLGVNQIASIGLADERVMVIPVGGSTHSLVQFALSPDGKWLVGTGEISGQLLVFDLSDPVKPVLLRTIDVGRMAFDPAFTPDGRSIYVPVKSTNEIVVIETTGWKVTARFTHESLKQPHQIVFSRDGATAFVTTNNKMDHMADPAHAGHAIPPGAPGTGGLASLVVIDTRTNRVVNAIELGKNLTGMGTRAGR